MRSQSHPQVVVEYASSRTQSQASSPDPIAATVLCLPGLFCWMVLLYAISGDLPFARHSDELLFGLGLFALVSWPIAVIFAVGSLFSYLRSEWRKPWYIWINLAVNTSGLLFTAWILVMFVFHR